MLIQKRTRDFRLALDLFSNSKWVEVMAPLHIDLMMQDRYLMPHTDVRIELHRNIDPLLLLCFQAKCATVQN